MAHLIATLYLFQKKAKIENINAILKIKTLKKVSLHMAVGSNAWFQ